jgi:lipid A ethanolaminephosphotransferase
MILWISDVFARQYNLQKECLADKISFSFSHDNMFHSLLGMLDIQTRERNPDLDIFASCKLTK